MSEYEECLVCKKMDEKKLLVSATIAEEKGYVCLECLGKEKKCKVCGRLGVKNDLFCLKCLGPDREKTYQKRIQTIIKIQKIRIKKYGEKK